MSGTERLVTAEEFARMPEDDLDRYELVEGRLVRMTPVNADHGRTVAQITYLLKAHLKNRPAGIAVVETGFTLASNPDTVRRPGRRISTSGGCSSTRDSWVSEDRARRAVRGALAR